MSILQNAIQALECGIEDYRIGTDARLKSAIRNVHAGVLLLFKQKLSLLSPTDSDEVLLKHKVLPEIVGSSVVWKGRGRKTVDVQNIEDRFGALGISVNWSAFKDINRIRNDIEHYFTTANDNAIREVIAKSFGIASDFLTIHLNLDPKKQFSKGIWDVFIEVKDVYDREKNSCVQSHERMDTESDFVLSVIGGFSCDGCGSDLIYIQDDGIAECRSCSKIWDREELIEAIIESALAGDNYMSVMDGGDPEAADCPECGVHAFIVEEMACAACGEHQQGDCTMCGECIPVEELDGSGFCGHCNHLLSKDD